MKLRSFALVAIIGLTITSPTYANNPAVREHFTLLFEDGARLAGEQDYEGAVRQFERAMAYSPSGPNLLWNMASCHLMLGNRDRALVFFEAYMEKVPRCQTSDEMIILMNRLHGQDPVIADDRVSGELLQALSETPCAVAEERGDEDEGAPGTGPTEEWRRPGWRQREVSMRAVGVSHYRTASGLFDERNFLDALVEFERSFAYRPLRNTVWNIASCHVNLGHRDLSQAFFQRFVDDVDGLAEDPQVQASIQAIGAQVPDIPDVGVRARLWRMISQAVSRVIDTAEEVGERLSR